MAPSARLEGVSKRFGDLTAVRELDLETGLPAFKRPTNPVFQSYALGGVE
jgi:hypothetical protein